MIEHDKIAVLPGQLFPDKRCIATLYDQENPPAQFIIEFQLPRKAEGILCIRFIVQKRLEQAEEEYILRLKVIPFSSLGKQNGMLLGIKADKVIIKSDEEEKENDNVIIGIYNKFLTKRGEYRALLGIELEH